MIHEMLTPLIIAGIFFLFALILARRYRKTGHILSGCFLVLILFLIYFARNPERQIPAGTDLIVAPADGRIIRIESSDSSTTVAIFLSLTDVHINRIPCGGTVMTLTHIDGKFRPAFSDQAGKENERMRTVLQTPFGEVTMIQIAGLVARRIVCRLHKGQFVKTGEVFGMIKFGSCVELELPTGVQLLINKGDRVRAGETLIGKFTHDLG